MERQQTLLVMNHPSKWAGHTGEPVCSNSIMSNASKRHLSEHPEQHLSCAGCGMHMLCKLYVQSTPPLTEMWCACRNVKIVKLQAYGCFVSLNSHTQGLVHVSELDTRRVSNPADLFSEGDEMDVKVLEKNQRGQLRLSRSDSPLSLCAVCQVRTSFNACCRPLNVVA